LGKQRGEHFDSPQLGKEESMTTQSEGGSDYLLGDWEKTQWERVPQRMIRKKRRQEKGGEHFKANGRGLRASSLCCVENHDKHTALARQNLKHRQRGNEGNERHCGQHFRRKKSGVEASRVQRQKGEYIAARRNRTQRQGK